MINICCCTDWSEIVSEKGGLFNIWNYPDPIAAAPRLFLNFNKSSDPRSQLIIKEQPRVSMLSQNQKICTEAYLADSQLELGEWTVEAAYCAFSHVIDLIWLIITIHQTDRCRIVDRCNVRITRDVKGSRWFCFVLIPIGRKYDILKFAQIVPEKIFNTSHWMSLISTILCSLSFKNRHHSVFKDLKMYLGFRNRLENVF